VQHIFNLYQVSEVKLNLAQPADCPATGFGRGKQAVPQPALAGLKTCATYTAVESALHINNYKTAY
jgi:hypothetical protein